MDRSHNVHRGESTARVARRGVWVSFLLAACSGGSEHPKVIGDPGSTGGGGSGGGIVNSGGSKGTGGGIVSTDAGFGDGGIVVGAPTVKVTSPIAATSPNDASVVIGDTLIAKCQATQSAMAGSTAVDSSTVKIAVLDAMDQVVTELPGTPSTDDASLFQATFTVASIANGAISIRCKASDKSTPAKTGTDEIATLFDHGPTVAVTTPAPDSAYPLTGAVPFAFRVTPAPLGTGDTNADVTTVTLSVNGVTIPLVRDPMDAMGYKLSVDFNDTTVFPQAPMGMVPVEIHAKDSRKPTAAERVTSYRFALDGTGPVITLTKPKNQDIIGGKVTMEFTVIDALAGLDSKTLSVELNQVAKFYSPTDTNWTNNNKGSFTYTFDGANVAGSKVQVTVNLTASDIAGNKTAGESVVLYLDNYPPIIDLDPPNVRQLRKVGTDIQCSESFDPLGPMAASDGDLVLPFTTFRALVWDTTNAIAGQTVFYYATTDQSSVYLYLQPDGATKPLLIDTDGDGICDKLDTSPGGTPIPNLRLGPVMPAGTAYFATDMTDQGADPLLSGCMTGADTTPPAHLCDQNVSDMTEVIRHNAANVEPVVYGIGGLTGLECTGTGWELSAQLMGATQKQGWFCLAAVATDKVGNSAISPPLRVCLADNISSPACNPTLKPSCTDGCTAPPPFDVQFMSAH
jgi:hypothetical protein